MKPKLAVLLLFLAQVTVSRADESVTVDVIMNSKINMVPQKVTFDSGAFRVNHKGQPYGRVSGKRMAIHDADPEHAQYVDVLCGPATGVRDPKTIIGHFDFRKAKCLVLKKVKE